jgi:hypothetical protein
VFGFVGACGVVPSINKPLSLITAVPIIKLFAWGEGDSGGHVLRETTSRGLCGLVCPSRTSERGGDGDHVKERGGGEGERDCTVRALPRWSPTRVLVCVFITAVPSTKLFARGEGDSGGHVLRETTSRGLCGLVCPSRTSEKMCVCLLLQYL